MKRILLLISVIITCLNVTAQDNSVKSSGKYQNDVESENLKGKVKSVIYYKYSLVNKEDRTLETEWNSKSIYNYNKAGNVKKTYLYTKSRGLTHHSATRYDNKGRKIQSTDKDGKITSASSYRYDNQQNLVETAHLNSYPYINLSSTSTPFMVNTYRIIYNKFGKRDTMYNYYRNIELSYKTVYQYDEKGNCIKETRYKPDGSLNRELVYIYDNHNNKIQEHKYNSAGVKINQITYSYDNMRNLVLEIDSNVNIGELPREKRDNNTYSKNFKYENFDKYGNWLKRSTITDGKPIYVTKREITYY